MFGTLSNMELHVRDLYDDVDDGTDHEGDAAVDGSAAPAPLTQVLAALGERVSPISLSGERVLPVAPDLQGLFPEGGLVRGRVLSCAGSGATSIALSVVSAAATAGSWVALVDVPTIGLDAASELGVPLERVVAIDASPDNGNWADVVSAAADGFELLIVRVPADVPASTLRRVSTRLQQRGVVMLVLGDPGALVCDGVLDAAKQTWSGIGAGWGHLTQRVVEVQATGRRMPGRRCVTLSMCATPGTMPQAVGSMPEAVAVDRVLSNAS